MVYDEHTHTKITSVCLSEVDIFLVTHTHTHIMFLYIIYIIYLFYWFMPVLLIFVYVNDDMIDKFEYES